MTSQGIVNEFKSTKLRDERLSKRLEQLAESASRSPEKSFPQLLDDAALEGAYRFFGNEKVTADAILAPHIASTIERATGARRVIAHDTTTLSFRAGGERVGLGEGRKGSQVLHAHVSLAVDELHNPLGVLALGTHVGKSATENHRRWFEQAESVSRQLGKDAALHVMDREADDYDVLWRLVEGGHHFVIRAQYDRVSERDGQVGKLRELVPNMAAATRDVVVEARTDFGRGQKQRTVHHARTTRSAELYFSGTTLQIRKPSSAGPNSPPQISLNVVRVWENNAPDGEKPIEWLLLTTEPSATKSDLLRVADYYRARWVVEEYFKALKSGCAIEKRQLESRPSLENALAIFIPVAWSLLGLRTALRRIPNSVAGTIITISQLKVLTAIARSRMPLRPTVKDVVLAIARLGGHLKRNGPPGWITLARGLDELTKALAGYRLAKSEM